MGQFLTDKTLLTNVADEDLMYVVDVSDTTDSAAGTSKKATKGSLLNFYSAPLAAQPGKVNLSEAPNNGVSKVILAAPAAMSSDRYVNFPDAEGTVALMEVIYPVGTIYTNKTVSTNPATLFGFGTWVAVEDRIIVAKGSTFATAGATGGAVNKTLATAELPASGLTFSGTTSNESATHTHPQNATTSTDNAAPLYPSVSARGSVLNLGSSGATNANSTGHTHTYSGTTSNMGSGNAFSLMNPYLVAYMWERTA